MSFIKKLQTNINRVTEGYFANWTPESSISVGDYGFVDEYRFTRDGNISSYESGLDLDSERVKTATFEREDGLKVTKKLSVDGALGETIDDPNAKVSLNLQFGSEGSFLYHLKDITNIQFKERRVAFEKIGTLILSGTINWLDAYVLVVEVKQAGQAVIIVADSANAKMQIECNGSDGLNLANATGNIGYIRDSSKVIRYEVTETISPLYRVIEFSSTPPGEGSGSPISYLLKKIKSWFNGNLPEPEVIYLTDYVENKNKTIGTFALPNGKSVVLQQKIEDIKSFIDKSEKEKHVEVAQY